MVLSHARPQGDDFMAIQEQYHSTYYPLLSYLPYSNSQQNWHLNYIDQRKLLVTYRADYPTFREEVMDWVRSKGVDSDSHEYVWEPYIMEKPEPISGLTPAQVKLYYPKADCEAPKLQEIRISPWPDIHLGQTGHIWARTTPNKDYQGIGARVWSDWRSAEETERSTDGEVTINWETTDPYLHTRVFSVIITITGGRDDCQQRREYYFDYQLIAEPTLTPTPD